MFKKSLFISATLMMSLAFVSCKKQEGCTDKNASNYSADAEEDDGTCTYKGSVVFWYDQATSEALQFDLSSSLSFYVDGVIVGSTATTQFWTGAPSCGANASITVEKDLGLIKSKSYSYEVKDDWGDVIWSGNVSFDANTCTAFELTY